MQIVDAQLVASAPARMVVSVMKSHSETQGDGEADRDQHDVDERQRGDLSVAPVPHSETSSEPITSVPGPSR